MMKRLSALTFVDFVLKKKLKGSISNAPEQGNMKPVDCSEKVKASFSKKRNGESNIHHSQNQGKDSSLRSQPDSGEETAKQDHCSDPNGFIQASSATAIRLNGKTPVKTTQDLLIEAEHVSPDESDKVVSSAKPGSDVNRKKEAEGEPRRRARPKRVRVQALSATDVSLNEKTPVKTTQDVLIEAEHASQDDFDEVVSSAKSGSNVNRKEETVGEFRHRGRPRKVCSPKFNEYWVPVSFSYLQLEKYCETLIKHQMFLCANSKHEIMTLHDVLARGRECCDHPYLLDSSLENYVNETRPVDELLTTGIEASGKLLLLEKLLQEAKRKDLRVVIVFQSHSSNSGSVKVRLRHLLDDIIRRRFGEDSYVHIYREFSRSQKQAGCDLFNNKESGSDWSPNNDIRCLRKMSFQSTTNQLKILRLYTPNSVEEKVVTLAKEGTSIESNLLNFSHKVGHMLLLWGAASLFSKLDEFHKNYTSRADLNGLSDEKLVNSVYEELLMLLSSQDSEECQFNLISKVPDENYDCDAEIFVHGEKDAPVLDDDIPPWAIWRSLLEERNPQWRLLPISSEKIRRRSDFSVRPANYCKSGKENEMTINEVTPPPGDEVLCRKPRSKMLRSPRFEKLSETSAAICDETSLRKMQELCLKQKLEIREFSRTKSRGRAKLDNEYRVEVELLYKTCGEGDKQEKLKELNEMYEKKVDQHNRLMDMKRKKMDNVHLASRMKISEGSISVSSTGDDRSPANSSEEANNAPITVSEPNKHSGEDTEVLPLEESDGECDAEISSQVNFEPCIEKSKTSSLDYPPVSGQLESNGENDVKTLPVMKVLNRVQPQPCALYNLEEGSNTTNTAGLDDYDCDMELSGEVSNREIIGCRVDEELDNLTTIDEPLRIQELPPSELPSCTATSIGPHLQQPQALLEQQNVSADPTSNDIRQNVEDSAFNNAQTSELLGSLQLNQNQSVACEQTQIPNSSHTPITPSLNNNFTGLLPLRSNLTFPTYNDPLENELRRIQHEKEEAKKITEQKKMYFKSACEKALEEIRKKYDSLCSQAEIENLQKNVALNSIRTKVQANKLLAETLMYYNKMSDSPLTQENVISAIFDLAPQQCNTPSQRTQTTNVRQNQVQVVQHLSELMSTEPIRLQTSSSAPSSHPPQNFPTVHPSLVAPPHLRPNPQSSISSFTGRPNQATTFGNWTRPYLANPSRPQFNPAVL